MLRSSLTTLRHIAAEQGRRLCTAKPLLLFAAYLFSVGDVQAQNITDILGPSEDPPQQSPVLTPTPVARKITVVQFPKLSVVQFPFKNPHFPQ